MAEDKFFEDTEFPALSPPSGKPFRLLNKYKGDLRFVDLLDTFSDYIGKAGKLVCVKPDETGLMVEALDIETDKNFVHIQISPDTEWIITHSLGKYPCVNVIDDEGHLALVDIEHVSINELKVKSSIAFYGIAYIN
jgi:hypothetical protein